MRLFRITSGAGVDMGVYNGRTEIDALDAMARAAGYASQAESPVKFDGEVTETRVTVELSRVGVPEADLEAWVIYAQARLDSMLGFDIDVSAADDDVERDIIAGVGESRTADIREAIAALWLDFCASPASPALAAAAS